MAAPVERRFSAALMSRGTIPAKRSSAMIASPGTKLLQPARQPEGWLYLNR
jgi:hypothetical protein